MSNLHGERVIKIKSIQVESPPQVSTTNDSLLIEKKHLLASIKDSEEKLQSIQKEQERLLQETTSRINEAKENWKNERNELMEAAKEEGYQAGFELGKQESLTQYQQLIEQANTITDAARKDYHAAVERSDQTILDLAIYISERILNQEIKAEPSAYIGLLQDAIKEIKDKSIISIYVPPNSYEFVLQQKSELSRIVEDDTKLSIYANDELPEDGCIIEHPFGQIDASIDTQLSQIRQALSEIMAGNE
ncbi:MULTISPECIES: flagellar assembly protein FliH [unclassified Virgibacillus]|uniref:flagellar assembly protein FliH n=1 Tax=unclassified Virgibacillus TaxID=2620237 RepID=UPI0024DEB7A2|nr:flagellar assembly protein FliH [Virgibacillus sp. LDC-1]